MELQRGLREVETRWGERRPLYTIVWDTPHGHVIYLSPMDEDSRGPDEIAPAAAQLIEPRWWATALVIVPFPEDLAGSEHDPIAYIYRLSADQPVRYSPTAARFAGMRRWWARNITMDDDSGEVERPAASASWVTDLRLAEISKALGVRIPLWVSDTLTEEAAARTLAYDRTFTVPDTTTGWPQAQTRVQLALDAGLDTRYAAGWGALAADAADRLQAIRAAHTELPDTGNGWYLVARPALPAPQVELEQHITATALVKDLEQVSRELVDIRRVEADLDVDDPLGEVYAEMMQLLEYQLHQSKQERAKQSKAPVPEYTAVADDGLMTYVARWDGPVVDAWKATLTPVEDVEASAALRLRRVRRLLRGAPEDPVVAIYRDPAARYVLVRNNRPDAHEPDLWFAAEWPQDTAVVDTWTDKTVLAADHDGGMVALFALTPTDDGQMRVDPVPLPARSGREAHGYGYSGGTPTTTYWAIARCALGLTDNPLRGRILHVLQGENGEDVSQLWHAISTTKGSLRLSWPQVQLWARADLRRARGGEKVDA